MSLIPFRAQLLCAAFLAVLMLLCTEVSASERRALLVGCSQYPLSNQRPLPGTENDVAAFSSLLTDDFNFEVVTLVGWPDSEEKRPTYVNICKAFEDLVGQSKHDDQVVILLSGHGRQVLLPSSQADLLSVENPEPDGYDEAFIAADYKSGSNMILDNQIGKWVGQLKARGAHVWIIFDSCHSGTMVRSGLGGEPMELTHSEAEISREESEATERRVKELAERADDHDRSDGDGVDLTESAGGTGSVIAFYAAQDFEKALQVTRPKEADRSDSRFKHSLFSYHLCQLLNEITGETTYRDLCHAAALRFRAEGLGYPTPSWEGDADRQVLGLKRWPRRDRVTVTNSEGAVHFDVGLLKGVAEGTVLALYATSDTDRTTPLGYFRVERAETASSVVTAISYNDVPISDPANLPTSGIYGIASSECKSERVSVHINMTSNERCVPLDSTIATAVERAAMEANAAFALTNSDDCEWVLSQLTPAVSKAIGYEGGAVGAILVPKTFFDTCVGDMECGSEEIATGLQRVPHLRLPKECLQNPDTFVSEMSNELSRVVRWNNIWRVAKAYSDPSPLVSKHEIALEVGRTNSHDDPAAATNPSSTSLKVGDSYTVKVVNRGYHPYWYTAFLLDGRYGVTLLATGSIPGKDNAAITDDVTSREIFGFDINSESIGTNGIVLVAVRQKDYSAQPDFQGLKQQSLGSGMNRGVTYTISANTPFEQALASAVGGGVAIRGVRSAEEPQIDSWSWVTAP